MPPRSSPHNQSRSAHVDPKVESVRMIGLIQYHLRLLPKRFSVTPHAAGKAPLDDLSAYWDRRHQTEGSLRSGGHISRTEAENAAFYLLRAGLVIGLLGGFGGEPGRNSVLDAGTGKGYFAEYLASCGYGVTAIDASPSAIAAAESNTDGNVTYIQGDLSSVPSLGTFDAVLCIDVLFHIVDDSHWTTALDGLCSAVRPGGILIYSDAPKSDESVLGGYIRHRSPRSYDNRLRYLGFRRTGFKPYDIVQNDLGYYRYERR